MFFKPVSVVNIVTNIISESATDSERCQNQARAGDPQGNDGTPFGIFGSGITRTPEVLRWHAARCTSGHLICLGGGGAWVLQKIVHELRACLPRDRQ